MVDLFHGHIGGIDTLARGLPWPPSLAEDSEQAAMVEQRYAGWSGELGAAIMSGQLSLAELGDRVAAGEITPSPVSGHQELYENVVNRHAWRADSSS